MHCRNCGETVDPNAWACPKCGCRPILGTAFCSNCGAQTQPGQVLCVKCGAALVQPGHTNRKLVAGLLAILLGMFGIHKFFLGYTREGLIMLLVTVLTIFLLAWIPAIIGIAEGIIYLTMTDQEFDAIYVQGRKYWF